MAARTGPTCGAPKSKSKEPCGQPAGYRTDHPGRGPCATHRGNTPGMRKRYAREKVAEEVAAWQRSQAFPGMVEAVASGPEVLLRSMARGEATVEWIRGRMGMWDLPEPVGELGGRLADDDGEPADRRWSSDARRYVNHHKGTSTGLYSLTQYRESDDGAVIGESERAAWMTTLQWWEEFTAKTSAKVSQLGIQESALRLLAAQAPNIEAVLLRAAGKVGLDLSVEAVRLAVAAAAREVAPEARPASLHDVQVRGILTA